MGVIVESSPVAAFQTRMPELHVGWIETESMNAVLLLPLNPRSATVCCPCVTVNDGVL